MHHPCSLSERRHNRAVIMARRRNILRRFYLPSEIARGFVPEDNRAWYSCDKWNLNCTCRVCKYSRQFIDERKRRQQLKRDVDDNLQSWLEL